MNLLLNCYIYMNWLNELVHKWIGRCTHRTFQESVLQPQSSKSSSNMHEVAANAKRILVPPQRLQFWHTSLKFLWSVWRTVAVANVTYLITDSMSLPSPPFVTSTSLHSNIASLGAGADHRCISLPDVSTNWNFYPAFFYPDRGGAKLRAAQGKMPRRLISHRPLPRMSVHSPCSW